MAPYIFGKRNLIHVINLRETVRGLIVGKKFVERVCGQGKNILFVGTKNQARNAVKNQALRCGMHYVNERWLGGTLTNFRTIRSRLSRLLELEEMEKVGQMALFSKKMIATLTREREKIQQNLEGIRNMEVLPGALIIIDPRREKNAVAEANKLGIPIVALTDTDCDPSRVDIVVPGNDDAMRAGEIVCSIMADAALAGKAKAPTVAVQPAASVQAAPKAAEEEEGGRGRPQRQRRQRPAPQKRMQVRRRAPAAETQEAAPAEAAPAQTAEAAPEAPAPAAPAAEAQPSPAPAPAPTEAAEPKPAEPTPQAPAPSEEPKPDPS